MKELDHDVTWIAPKYECNTTYQDEENWAKIQAFNERMRDELILDLANEVNELREALRVKDLRILELLGLYEDER
jgi:uncharacterized protein YeaO (DUF488 family)